MQLQVQFADLVQEQDSFTSPFCIPEMPASCSRKGAFLVPEQLAFHEVLRDRRAVNGNEGIARTACTVQVTGTDLLARTRLPGQEDGRRQAGDPLEKALDLLHLSADTRGQVVAPCSIGRSSSETRPRKRLVSNGFVM